MIPEGLKEFFARNPDKYNFYTLDDCRHSQFGCFNCFEFRDLTCYGEKFDPWQWDSKPSCKHWHFYRR